jgi:hypothetical protein
VIIIYTPNMASSLISSVDAAGSHKRTTKAVKHLSNKDKVRESARKSMAAHRSRKKNEAEALQKGINEYRGLLGEELLDFTKEKKTSKGTRRPTYTPPEGVAMTHGELEQWKRSYRLERKRLWQAKADREKKEELQALRREYDRVTKKYLQVFGLDALPSDDHALSALHVDTAGDACASDVAATQVFASVKSLVVEPTASSGFNATDLMASFERGFTKSVSNLMAATNSDDSSHDEVMERYLQEFGRDARARDATETGTLVCAEYATIEPISLVYLDSTLKAAEKFDESRVQVDCNDWLQVWDILMD